jgi:Response regulator containing CheY-like receiver, AAA-type ATPase, and DNA-binding domains
MPLEPIDIGRTLRAISHDINNPLAALMLNVEMLKEDGQDDSSELIDEIERAAKRIATIVRGLETFLEPRQRPVIGDTAMDDSPHQPSAKSSIGGAAPGRSSGQTPSGRTILVVDDEESVRAIVHKILVRHGHNVLEAEHGADAVRVSNDYGGAIDLLVTDLYMPGLRGPEIAETLEATRPAIKVLYMSGYGDEDLARSGVDPALPFLRKPFSVQELSAAVEKALSEGGK